MPDVNYLAKVIKDDAFVQQSLLGQDNDLREVLFLGQRLKKHPKGATQLAVSLQVARASLSSPPKSNKKS